MIKIIEKTLVTASVWCGPNLFRKIVLFPIDNRIPN